MSDNILTAVLTFSLLAGGTVAIGSEMFEARHVAHAATPVVVMPQVTITAPRATPPAIVTMPQVTITAQRAAEPALVTLPMVVVTGKREALTVSVETRASEAPRIE